MGDRIAEVGGECLTAVLSVDLFEALVDKGEGFVPAAGRKLAIGAAQHRRAQAVWISVEGADVGALRADEAVA